MGWLALACGWLFIQPWGALGATNLSLPLEGYYRPGRFMPVRIMSDAAEGTLTIRGAGAVDTEVEPSPGNRDIVVPWLAFSGTIQGAQWIDAAGSHGLGMPLRPLADDERLVASAGAEPALAAPLFLGKRITSVSLDLSGPAFEPAEAWTSLDAIVLSESAAARLSEGQRATLATAGVALIVRSDHRPDDHWPWRPLGQAWALQLAPAGPASAIDADAYMPTYEWQRGWPAHVRGTIVWAAALFCLLTAISALWGDRRAVLVVLACCLGFGVAAASWYARHSSVLELTAGVMLRRGPMAQFDLWAWQSPVRTSDATFPAAGFTRPILASQRQADHARLRLVCSPRGEPDHFASHLEPGQSIAFLTRLFREPPDVSPGPASTVLRRFADLCYTRPAERVLGQFDAEHPYTSERMPVVVIGR